MAKLFANRGDPDQTPRSAASDLGLHCLQLSFYGSPDYNRLEWTSFQKGFMCGKPESKSRKICNVTIDNHSVK